MFPGAALISLSLKNKPGSFGRVAGNPGPSGISGSFAINFHGSRHILAEKNNYILPFVDVTIGQSPLLKSLVKGIDKFCNFKSTDQP